MDASKPYKSIGFGAMDATKPYYEFIRFAAFESLPCGDLEPRYLREAIAEWFWTVPHLGPLSPRGAWGRVRIVMFLRGPGPADLSFLMLWAVLWPRSAPAPL